MSETAVTADWLPGPKRDRAVLKKASATREMSTYLPIYLSTYLPIFFPDNRHYQ